MEITLNLDELCQINWIPQIKEYLIINKEKNNCFLVEPKCRHENTKFPALKRGDFCLKCPKHGWELNLLKGSYINPHGLKHPKSKYLAFIDKSVVKIRKKELLESIEKHKWIKNYYLNEKANDLNVSFVNHACLLIETETISLVTDPWIIGSAFSTGWFLKYQTKKEDIYKILNSEFAYISHSHPDHLNPISLIWLKNKNWDPVFIIPKFKKSDLTKDLLISLGFSKFIELGHGDIVELKQNSKFIVQLIFDQSGRNDSGIFITYKNLKIVNLVDIPSPDIDGLEDIDLALLPFANGASGYPICWPKKMNQKELLNYRKISNLNALKVFYQRSDLIKAKYTIPFAGFFCSPLKEDEFIQKFNIINSPEDVIDFDKNSNKRNIINPLFGLQYDPIKESFCSSFKIKRKRFLRNDLNVKLRNILLNRYQDFSKEELINFLNAQDFHDNLHVCIFSKDLEFKKNFFNLCWDFRTNEEISRKKFMSFYSSSEVRSLKIFIRNYSLGYTIRNSLPWEEFSIGFQARFIRNPDVYNFKFWDYFQNEYKYTFPIFEDYINLWNSYKDMDELFDLKNLF